MVYVQFTNTNVCANAVLAIHKRFGESFSFFYFLSLFCEMRTWCLATIYICMCAMCVGFWCVVHEHWTEQHRCALTICHATPYGVRSYRIIKYWLCALCQGVEANIIECFAAKMHTVNEYVCRKRSALSSLAYCMPAKVQILHILYIHDVI